MVKETNDVYIETRSAERSTTAQLQELWREVDSRYRSFVMLQSTGRLYPRDGQRWSAEEDRLLRELRDARGHSFDEIAEFTAFAGRSAHTAAHRYYRLTRAA